MQTLTADQASTILQFHLSTIQTQHQFIRTLLQAIPEEKLDYQTDPGSLPLRDLGWYIAMADHVLLSAICNGKFGLWPERPADNGVGAMVEWFERSFNENFGRLTQLTGDDLLRPLDFFGTVKPAIEFLPIYLGNLTCHTGQLMAQLRVSGCYLQVSLDAMMAAPVQTQETDGELNETELSAVAGGNFVIVTNHVIDPSQTITITTTPATYENTSEGIFSPMGGGNAMNTGMFFGGLLGGGLGGWGASIGLQTLFVAFTTFGFI